MLPVVVVAGERIARDGLRNLRQRRMFFEVRVFVLAGQLDEKLFAVVIRGKQSALVADEQAAAAGDFAKHGLDVGGKFARRFVAAVVAAAHIWIGRRLAAVIPPERDRIEGQRVVPVKKGFMGGGDFGFARGKFKTDFGAEGIRFIVHHAERRGLDFRRIAQVQGRGRAC